ncbi:MAG: hypothetical protein SGI83_03525 [Bacteroidota bacterium]|nr:hypothetical protein [Bacteroidota bacterium]
MRRLSAVIIWMMGNFGMNAFSQTSFFSKADESTLLRTPKKVEVDKYFASSLHAKGVELFL